MFVKLRNWLNKHSTLFEIVIVTTALVSMRSGFMYAAKYIDTLISEDAVLHEISAIPFNQISYALFVFIGYPLVLTLIPILIWLFLVKSKTKNLVFSFLAAMGSYFFAGALLISIAAFTTREQFDLLSGVLAISAISVFVLKKGFTFSSSLIDKSIDKQKKSKEMRP